MPVQYNNYFIDLTGSFEDYIKKLREGGKQLKKRRHFIKAAGGKLDLREYRRPEEMAELYRHARSISCKTYQERLLKLGFPRGESVVPALQEKAAQGTVRSYTLGLHDRPIAFLHCITRGDLVLPQFCGYDPEYRNLGPGAVLLLCAIERLFDEGGFRLLDHGQGEGEHKKQSATGFIRCADVFYLRRTWPTPCSRVFIGQPTASGRPAASCSSGSASNAQSRECCDRPRERRGGDSRAHG